MLARGHGVGARVSAGRGRATAQLTVVISFEFLLPITYSDRQAAPANRLSMFSPGRAGDASG